MPKKINKTKKRKSLKSNISKNEYKELIKKRKTNSINKKDNKILESELNKKYCKCIKTLKKKYPKTSRIYKNKFGICMNSIYKNRGFDPPYNVSNLCKLYYSF